MIFDKYIDNPSGGMVYSNRQMYKAMYQDKFKKVLLREQGNIDYTVYHDKDPQDSYYIHMKIPSEVIEKFYYDVVIRLYATKNAQKANSKLRQYYVQFYSNDPAFMYTFAHSFAKNKLFIKDLEPKMSRKALTNIARERNPKDDVWYVKSLYFAYLTMEKYNLFSRAILDDKAKPYSKRSLLSNIEHAEKKVKARQEEQEKLNKKKKREATRNTDVKTDSAPITRSVQPVRKAKTTKTVGTVKTAKIIGAKKPMK